MRGKSFDGTEASSAHIKVIEQTLGSEFRIVRAMNGMEAFAYLDSGKEFPTLMLLDVMMPGLTGFQVCDAPARCAAFGKVSVIVPERV